MRGGWALCLLDIDALDSIFTALVVDCICGRLCFVALLERAIVRMVLFESRLLLSLSLYYYSMHWSYLGLISMSVGYSLSVMLNMR